MPPSKLLLMRNPMKWDGCVLRGPLTVLLREKLARLPSGPPGTGPFSMGTWHLGMNSNTDLDGVDLRHYGVAVDQLVVIKFAIAPAAGSSAPEPVVLGPVVLQFGTTASANLTIPAPAALVRAHLNIGSRFELSVASGAQAAASYLGDLTRSPRPKPQAQVYTIKVTGHSFHTYHATWVWILSQQITFAALAPAPAASHPGQLTALLPPVSPKSVYRLAHLLELSQLKAVALAALRRSLTVENVAHQLFSSTANTYDEVRTVAAEYAARNWVKVRETVGMREMQARVAAREVDQAGVVMQALADAALARASRA